ncbi:MAG: hypothetical protein B6D64_02220 [Bacteroidetes bacterium 4484_276]|nr:MAG: hypothetical protein B6D64_02220 [Bacteroidetes bacterium 4484_276]
MAALFNKHIVVSYVVLLIVIFFLGSALILAFNISLSSSLNEIEGQRRNQEVKNLICQDIIMNLNKLENSFFRIVVMTSEQAIDSEFNNYGTYLRNIGEDLILLKEGGIYNQQILLNLEDIDNYNREVPFVATDTETVPFEFIEIAPKLVLAEDIAIKLKKLISGRNKLKSNTRAFADIRKSIFTHVKHAPPLFLRMHENANAIFYESQMQFEEIDNLVIKTKKKYFLAEILIVSIIMALFIIISIIIIRNILKILLKQKKTQEKMAAEEKKLSTIMNSVQAGIVLIDEKTHTFIDVNPKAAEMFGASKENIIGKDCHQHICPVNGGICAISDLKQQVHNAERVIARNNGSKKDVLKSATKVNIAGKNIIVETFVDITEVKQAEGKIKQKSLELEKQFEKSEKQRKAGMVILGDLNKATKKLKVEISERKLAEKSLQDSEEKLRTLNIKLKEKVVLEVAKSREKDRVMLVQSKQAAMGEMIGNIAHQWRQPLNDIGLYVQNIQDKYEYGELSEDALAQTVEKTMDKLEYMSQTIDDFRNFFRSDKNKKKFLLKDSIDKTLSLTEAGFKNNFIEINLYLQDNIYITGYPNEFSQAVLNILNNAKDILVERKIEGPQVKINLSRQEKNVILTVSDNAGGIDENIIDKIFEPYYTTKGKLTGTGLGLYISKTIIERNMMGSLTVRNIKDGAEFKIEFKTDL